MSTVGNLMKRKNIRLVTVDPDQMVINAVKAMNNQDIGAVVVLGDDGAVVGLFTERDVLKRVVGQSKPPESTPIRDVMTSPVACCKLSTTLEECRRVMTLEHVRHLPVVDAGKLVGMVSIRDILARQMQIEQTTVEYLQDYLHGKL